MNRNTLSPAQYAAIETAAFDVTAPLDGCAVIYDGRVARAFVAAGLATASPEYREVINAGGGVSIRRGVEYRFNAKGAQFVREVMGQNMPHRA